jgi:hypothetical protein
VGIAICCVAPRFEIGAKLFEGYGKRWARKPRSGSASQLPSRYREGERKTRHGPGSMGRL